MNTQKIHFTPNKSISYIACQMYFVAIIIYEPKISFWQEMMMIVDTCQLVSQPRLRRRLSVGTTAKTVMALVSWYHSQDCDSACQLVSQPRLRRRLSVGITAKTVTALVSWYHSQDCGGACQLVSQPRL